MTGKLPTCYGLASDTNLQSVSDLLRGNYVETGVVDFGKTCYGEVANLLWTFRLCCGLVSDTTGKSPTCYGHATGKLV